MSVFKSCDIRGLYGSELTAPFAASLGQAVGTMLAGGRVVVGGDVRPSTPLLKGALIEGLIQAGCYVLDLGLVPTSAVYFAQKQFDAVGAVIVTASHNPPGYNGFKMMLGERPISEMELLELRERMEAGDFRQGEGYWDRADAIEAYQAELAGFFKPAQQALRVVVDAGNGCLGRIAPAALRQQGYTVSELFCEIDGRFPNRNPNPAVAAHLDQLVRRVRAERAGLGVAYDGDGDRAVFVDETGRVLAGEYVMVLFIRHLLPQISAISDRKVVYDIKCSSIVAEEIRRWQGTPRMEPSGHTYIKTALLEEKAALGGEISGHYFFRELGRDDALYATLLLLHILQQADRPLSALVEAIPHYPITPDLRLPCPPEEQGPILEALQAAFSDHDVSTIDGVRVDFGDGWALIRSSVTEPLLTIRFEAHTPERLAEIQAEVGRRVPALGRLLATGAKKKETV